MSSEELADKLKAQRKLTSITQRDLAELADISIQTVIQLESGVANPTLDVMNKVGSVLGLEISMDALRVEGKQR